MADMTKNSGPATVTPEAFLADRMRFWDNATRYMTYSAVALVVLLLILWWALV